MSRCGNVWLWLCVVMCGCANDTATLSQMRQLEQQVAALESKLERFEIDSESVRIKSTTGQSAVTIGTGDVTTITLHQTQKERAPQALTISLLDDLAVITGPHGVVEWDRAAPRISWRDDDGNDWVSYGISDRLRVADFISQLKRNSEQPEQWNSAELAGFLDAFYTTPSARNMSLQKAFDVVSGLRKLSRMNDVAGQSTDGK